MPSIKLKLILDIDNLKVTDKLTTRKILKIILGIILLHQAKNLQKIH